MLWLWIFNSFSEIFADQFNTKLCGVVNMPQGCDAIESHLDKFQEWAQVNRIRFKKIQMQWLAPGLWQQLLSVEAGECKEKDIRVPVNSSQQCALAVRKANHNLGCL